jgi:hypothetical protein
MDSPICVRYRSIGNGVFIDSERNQTSFAKDSEFGRLSKLAPIIAKRYMFVAGSK